MYLTNAQICVKLKTLRFIKKRIVDKGNRPTDISANKKCSQHFTTFHTG